MVGGTSDAGDQESAATGDEANVTSSQRTIPIVDTETPGKVAISMRAAGVTVVTYLSRGEGKANGQGQEQEQEQGGGEAEVKGEAQQDTSVQDLVVTLSETSARDIEACSEIDSVRGKVRKIGSAGWFGRQVGHKLLSNLVAPCPTCWIGARMPKAMFVLCICGACTCTPSKTLISDVQRTAAL